MARTVSRENFRVTVYPRNPGDFGVISFGGVTREEVAWEEFCNDIAADIRRHVDGIARDGVHVEWDDVAQCSHCSYLWTEDSPHYNGGCCEVDQAPIALIEALIDLMAMEVSQ